MPYDRFLIAPYSEGLVSALEPWLIPDEAFTILQNAYVWRGRVRKRFGGELMGNGATSSMTEPLKSRFRIPIPTPLTLAGGINVGITTSAGNATNPALPIPWPRFKVGSSFIINNWHYYVTALGSPAALTLEAVAPGDGIFDTTTGIYAFTGVSINSQIYYLPNGDNVTTAAGVANGVVDGAPYTIGTQFSIGDVIFTVFNPAAGANPMLRTDGSAEVATFDLATGIYNITIAALPDTQVYFYPGLPVMGLCNYEKGSVNNHPSYGFDTKFAYLFANAWNRVGAAQDVVFHGDDSDFFWTCDWNGIADNQTALFITNFNATIGVPGVTDDPIWFYNQDIPIPWAVYSPTYTAFNAAGDFIYTARIIVAFKDRLLLLNTVEQNAARTLNTAYTNRCRYSFNGSPFAAGSFIQHNEVGFKGAGYLDAATEEAIISAEFIKDRLIVYFERSTWELAYTGNQVLPFTWQKINAELGAESTFSEVPFDKAVLGIGNTGVHACNGSNVERIDVKIPEKIFQIVNKNEGVSRVVGIRDYYVEMVYWTFPNLSSDTVFSHFPNMVMVYNYVTDSWAFNDDCITMFGNFEQQRDVTWADVQEGWQEYNSTWNSGVQQSQFRQVIAGNQQGYVFIVTPDKSRNAPVMSITNITVVGTMLQLTIIDHTLRLGDFIYINDTQGVIGLDRLIVEVQVVIDKDTIQINTPTTYAGTYTGGGNITRVSAISIQTKQYNPYIDKGRDVYVAKIDFGVKQTEHGELTIDYSPSASNLSIVNDGMANGTLLGTSVLETFPYPTIPLEAVTDRLWHPVYFQTEGECIQFTIYMNYNQMTTPDIAFEDFVLEGMILHTMPTTRRLQ